jgi:hypothetical protein
MMIALEPSDVALTLCFTPAHLGLEEHHTSPPKDDRQFAEFAEWAVKRYAPKLGRNCQQVHREGMVTV